MNTTTATDQSPVQRNQPQIFQQWITENGGSQESQPRRVTKKFHGIDISGWSGRVNFNDVQGYVENKRLTFYLNRWRNRRHDPTAVPTTQEIYEIMLEADAEETQEDKKVFHLDRLAKSIVRNGVQEEIIVFLDSAGKLTLWDGNRRFFSTAHIMKSEHDVFKAARELVQWMPCFLVETTGDMRLDSKRRHAILTETNFVKKDSISWPTYIKAEEVWNQYIARTKLDPTDPTLCREVKAKLAEEYGLFSQGKPSWRQVDRWVKMVNLAQEFKEYQEEDKQRDQDAVDLRVSNCFEYFDELSKPKVKEAIDKDPQKRDEVFDWLWDEKFPSFKAVRSIPKIYDDPVALSHMRSEGKDAFDRAEQAYLSNDPSLVKDTRAAGAKIQHFSTWLNSFKLDDFRQLDKASLERLKGILSDVTKMLEGLITGQGEEQVVAAEPTTSND